jgi:hypothetical protein
MKAFFYLFKTLLQHLVKEHFTIKQEKFYGTVDVEIFKIYVKI